MRRINHISLMYIATVMMYRDCGEDEKGLQGVQKRIQLDADFELIGSLASQTALHNYPA